MVPLGPPVSTPEIERAARCATTGQVTIPELHWCAGHADAVEEHREDIEHQGPEQVVALTTAHGPVVLLSAILAQVPFRTSGEPEPFVSVALAGDHYD